ncbi:MAG: hypothetical protein LUH18_08135 [Oscillospiraceae bacterium]|nr:hypothetical protein [Oscillospiraceae bacterium]
MAKRLICVIISVLMIVSLLPTGAFATDVDEALASASSEEPTVADSAETDENVEESEVEETETVTVPVLMATASDSVFPSGGVLENATYELTGNETLDSITVASGVTATIDLKGYTLSAPITVNGGTLTITDSTATENGFSTSATGTLSGSLTVSSGSVTINGGTYTGTVTANSTLYINYGVFSSYVTGTYWNEKYVDDDYVRYTNANGTYLYSTNLSSKYAASVTVGTTTSYYKTFDGAMTVANSAEASEVVILTDGNNTEPIIKLTSSMTISGNITLNLNQNASIVADSTFTGSGNYLFEVTGSLTVKNCGDKGIGTATESSVSGIYVNGGTLTVGSGGKVSGYNAVVVANGGTVKVYGTVNGYNAGINSNSSTVVVSSGDVCGKTYGVYATNSSTVSVSYQINGSTTGSYGIYADNSTVNINSGATIDANTYGLYVTNNSIVNYSGGDIGLSKKPIYGIYTDNSTVYSTGSIYATDYFVYATYSSKVTISGGTYSDYTTTGVYSASNSAITISNVLMYATTCVETDGSGTVSITGGEFSSSVSDYCASGYKMVEGGTETDYTVVEDDSTTYTAQNTTSGAKYSTLQSAIDAASSGDTVAPLEDLNEEITVAYDSNVILDLAGYTLTGNITVESSTFTLNDSSTAGSGKLDGSLKAIRHTLATLDKDGDLLGLISMVTTL